MSCSDCGLWRIVFLCFFFSLGMLHILILVWVLFLLLELGWFRLFDWWENFELLRWAFIRKLILLPCYVTKWWYSLEDSFVFFLLVIESLVLCFHNGDVGMICFVNCTRWIGHGYFCTKWICLLRMDLLEVI